MNRRDGHVEGTVSKAPLKANPQKAKIESVEDLSSVQGSQQEIRPLEGAKKSVQNDMNTPPQPMQELPKGLSGKIENHAMNGEGEVEESDQARIERLGRERPTKFKSLGAELAFCYSIIASQFMAVSLLCCVCR